jgi:hypothetical protein
MLAVSKCWPYLSHFHTVSNRSATRHGQDELKPTAELLRTWRGNAEHQAEGSRDFAIEPSARIPPIRADEVIDFTLVTQVPERGLPRSSSKWLIVDQG